MGDAVGTRVGFAVAELSLDPCLVTATETSWGAPLVKALEAQTELWIVMASVTLLLEEDLLAQCCSSVRTATQWGSK